MAASAAAAPEEDVWGEEPGSDSASSGSGGRGGQGEDDRDSSDRGSARGEEDDTENEQSISGPYGIANEVMRHLEERRLQDSLDDGVTTDTFDAAKFDAFTTFLQLNADGKYQKSEDEPDEPELNALEAKHYESLLKLVAKLKAGQAEGKKYQDIVTTLAEEDKEDAALWQAYSDKFPQDGNEDEQEQEQEQGSGSRSGSRGGDDALDEEEDYTGSGRGGSRSGSSRSSSNDDDWGDEEESTSSRGGRGSSSRGRGRDDDEEDQGSSRGRSSGGRGRGGNRDRDEL